jgi:hypothetical protein
MMKDVDEPRMTAMTSKLSMRELEEFGDRGALLFSAAVDDDALHTLTAAVADWHPGKAGARLRSVAALEPYLAASGAVGACAQAVLGREVWPVRALLFDKSPALNWAVPWHQDRTIVVRQRAEVPGFGPWTTKGGCCMSRRPMTCWRGC